MIFEDYLKQSSELYPEKTAVICGDQSLTYKALWQQTLATAEPLPKNGTVVFR